MSAVKTSRRKKSGAARAGTAAKARTKAKKVSPARKPARAGMAVRRADFGAPIDGFFARQPTPLRAVLETLRRLVEEAAPEATASLKWGMPVYSIGRTMMCALARFKSHVNLMLLGPPDAFDDPAGLLEGEGKSGRHLKLRSVEEIPREAIRGWLLTAARVAGAQARQ